MAPLPGPPRSIACSGSVTLADDWRAGSVSDGAGCAGRLPGEVTEGTEESAFVDSGAAARTAGAAGATGPSMAATSDANMPARPGSVALASVSVLWMPPVVAGADVGGRTIMKRLLLLG